MVPKSPDIDPDIALSLRLALIMNHFMKKVAPILAKRRKQDRFDSYFNLTDEVRSMITGDSSIDHLDFDQVAKSLDSALRGESSSDD